MEREGLFGLMDDIANGRTVSSQPIDLPRIFAEHAARESEQKNRDILAERFRNALFDPSDDAGYDTAPWLRGL